VAKGHRKRKKKDEKTYQRVDRSPVIRGVGGPTLSIKKEGDAIINSAKRGNGLSVQTSHSVKKKLKKTLCASFYHERGIVEISCPAV